MDILLEKNDKKLNISLVGRLDTNTAPEFDNKLADEIEGINEIIINLVDLDYISSAGLRVVLKYHKQMASVKGKLVIVKPKEEVMEVFDMTGFSTFLNIEE